MDKAHRLAIKPEPGGFTCYLGDIPVFPGQDLEICLEGGVWLLGRFEWNHEPRVRPRLNVCCGGEWEDMDPETSTFPIPPEISFEIPRDALLRWPQKES